MAWLCPRDHELVRFKLFNETAGAALELSRFRARAKLPGSLRTAGETVRFPELCFCPGSLGAAFAPCPRPRRLKERVRRVDSFLRGVGVVGAGGTSAFLRGAEAGLSAEAGTAGGGTAATGGLAGFFRPKDSFLTRRLPAFAAFSMIVCAATAAAQRKKTARQTVARG